MGKYRLVWLDNLKGFLIILVVLGHCIQNTTDDYGDDMLFKYIYSFHMPLFMFVSGFACYKDRIEWLPVSKRFVQLIIPFLVWTGILSLLKQDPSLFIVDIIQPEKGLWFLWALFFITVIHTACCRLAYRISCKEEIICIIVSFALIATMRMYEFFCYPTIAKFFIYYVLGFYSRKYVYMFYVSKKNRTRFAFVCFLIFLVLGYYCTQAGVPSFLPSTSRALYGQLYNLFVSTLAIIALMLLFDLYFYKCSAINKLGGVTLGVYAIHRPIMALFPLNLISYNNSPTYYVLIFLLSCIITILSYFAVQILNINRYTSLLLNGLRQK